MKKFLLIFFKWSILILLVHLLLNLISILILLRIIPDNSTTLEIYKEVHKNKNAIAVIGGSNVQSNLDFKLFREELNCSIDFFSFPGSTNFNYVDYVFKTKVLDTNKYQKVFLYLPYGCYNNSKSMIHNGFGCFEIFTNKNYLSFLIKKNPSILFNESWVLNLYHQYKANTSLFRTKESINFYNVTYSSSNPLLENNKNNPNYVDLNYSIKDEKLFINSNPEDINNYKFSTKFYIIHPPIPDVRLNKKFPFDNKNKNQIINSYSRKRMDKKYFFDMGGHLNLKGRQIESKKILNYFKQTSQ